jgi:hypothetical protein
MSYFIKQQWSRPSKAIQWAFESTPREVRLHLDETYGKSNLWTKTSREGIGSLVMTVTTEWQSRQAVDQWWHDEALQAWHASIKQHNTENGIVLLHEETYSSLK